MKNYGFWFCIIVLLWIVYDRQSEVNELSVLVTDLNKLATEQGEVNQMQSDYIKLICRK